MIETQLFGIQSAGVFPLPHFLFFFMNGFQKNPEQKCSLSDAVQSYLKHSGAGRPAHTSGDKNKQSGCYFLWSCGGARKGTSRGKRVARELKNSTEENRGKSRN